MYRSATHAIGRIYAEEGLRGLLLPGLFATILRELSFSGLRFGLYSPIKQLSCDIAGVENTGSAPFIVKFISGFTTGTIGSIIANPCDLVKIRLQAEAGRVDPHSGNYSTGLRKGHQPTYSSTMNAFYRIWADEGVVNGLYRGASATALRAAFITGGQLASYDHTKYYLKREGILQEGVVLHIVGSVVAGLVACKVQYIVVSRAGPSSSNLHSLQKGTLAAPADLVKTKMMGQSGKKIYSGLADCFVKVTELVGRGDQLMQELIDKTCTSH